MPIKDITYMILAGMTFLFNFGAVLYFVFGIKFENKKLSETVESIKRILHNDKGKLQFQTTDDCKDCRETCRDEIRDIVKCEMDKHGESIKHLQTSLDVAQVQLNEITVWMPGRKNDRS